jgi:hypothetical protein
MLEPLESRTLMSATPVLFSPAVKTDRFAIRVELLKLKADVNNDGAALLVDNHALRVDKLHDNTTLAPLVKTLRADVTSFRLALKQDRLTESSNVLSDEAILVGDIHTYILDRKNPTARAAELSVITAERATLQSDMVAGLTQRLIDRQSETNTLATDEQAILTALPTSGASAKLAADVTTWLTDKSDSLARVTVDLQTLSADRTQLIADLSAE